MAKQTLLIVDDHRGRRTQLFDLVRTTFPQACVLSASNGEEALTLTVLRRPTLVVMDMALPQMNGLQTTYRIKQNVPETIVVILSLCEAPEHQADATAAGASAYVCQHNLHLELIPTLQKLLPPVTN